ncbi:MAG: GAF domain-containing protein, partial [Gemmatimonadales bacterium]
MTTAALTIDEVERLQARVNALEQERKHLLAVIEILQDIGGSLHFADIVQSVARRLGETFGLDRCSIFLVEKAGRGVRLVASYEDPGIRNYVVDVNRYPELHRALATGETVFIADAATDPALSPARGALAARRVKT